MKKKRIYFVCLTPTNFLHVLYYMHKVQWDEHIEKILVWAKPGKTKPEFKPYEDLFDRFIYLNYADSHYLVRLQFDKLLKSGRLFPFSKLGRVMKESEDNNILVCFNDSEYCTTKCIDFMSRHNNNEIVMMDDGTAIYFDQMINPPTKAAYVVNWILGTRLNTSVGTDPKINVLMVRYPDKLPPYKTCGHRVIPQNDIYRDSEFLHQIQKEVAARLPQKKGKTVLWLGQPLEETKIGVHQEEALLDIFQVFIKEGYRILIKPHPRERKEKYLRLAKNAGIEKYITVLDLKELYWIPIEAYVNLLAPEAAASFFSTAAGRIRDMGYRCDIWYCFDLLNVNLENDYLQGEAEQPHTFRVHSQKELEEKLKNQNTAQESRKLSDETELKEKNLNQDIAYFEQFGKE